MLNQGQKTTQNLFQSSSMLLVTTMEVIFAPHTWASWQLTVVTDYGCLFVGLFDRLLLADLDKTLCGYSLYYCAVILGALASAHPCTRAHKPNIYIIYIYAHICGDKPTRVGRFSRPLLDYESLEISICNHLRSLNTWLKSRKTF